MFKRTLTVVFDVHYILRYLYYLLKSQFLDVTFNIILVTEYQVIKGQK